MTLVYSTRPYISPVAVGAGTFGRVIGELAILCGNGRRGFGVWGSSWMPSFFANKPTCYNERKEESNHLRSQIGPDNFGEIDSRNQDGDHSRLLTLLIHRELQFVYPNEVKHMNKGTTCKLKAFVGFLVDFREHVFETVFVAE